jgi:hypothetical protein
MDKRCFRNLAVILVLLSLSSLLCSRAGTSAAADASNFFD